ncbi:hypothetical protein Glove_290g43 [Diversispora epigaea]|uniref:Uncharacterized protein n=1 Tax=Diversispora epigaea TaxID=1348612 RepID=A0A397I1M4_9GLOM|nr:hypothetical protein Glove_290g47 [Diversispora epigaea]RHZ69096.1 hypothetical protein Glove_290g43 [Diversispora epigaea]
MDNTGQYWTALENTGRCWTILGNSKQDWTTLGNARHCQTSLDNTGRGQYYYLSFTLIATHICTHFEKWTGQKIRLQLINKRTLEQT